MEQLKKWQIRIFILCWLAYAFAYLGRVNLSIAIPLIEQSLHFDKAQMGLLGSLFFWIYGTGQLINGYIGDKKSGRYMIFIGLFVCSIANIIFGFTSKFIIMAILWSINGYFLSMLWGPMTKILSNWFQPELRSNVAIAISTSMVGGFLISWGAIGYILSYLDWNWGFWLPGIIIFIFSFIFLKFMQETPENVHIPSSIVEEEEIDNEKNNLSLFQVIIKSKLWLIALACYSQGIIKDGITLWGPTLLMETHNLDIDSTVSYIIFIPIMNFFGMFIASRLNKRFNDKEKLTAIILFILGITSLICLIKFGSYNPVLAVILLGLSSAMMYGVNTILLGVIPLKFAKYKKSSSVAGFLNFNSYIAAGISSLITGIIVDSINWNAILLFWVAMSLIAIAALFIHEKLGKLV